MRRNLLLILLSFLSVSNLYAENDESNEAAPAATIVTALITPGEIVREEDTAADAARRAEMLRNQEIRRSRIQDYRPLIRTAIAALPHLSDDVYPRIYTETLRQLDEVQRRAKALLDRYESMETPVRAAVSDDEKWQARKEALALEDHTVKLMAQYFFTLFHQAQSLKVVPEFNWLLGTGDKLNRALSSQAGELGVPAAGGLIVAQLLAFVDVFQAHPHLAAIVYPVAAVVSSVLGGWGGHELKIRYLSPRIENAVSVETEKQNRERRNQHFQDQLTRHLFPDLVLGNVVKIREQRYDFSKLIDSISFMEALALSESAIFASTRFYDRDSDQLTDASHNTNGREVHFVNSTQCQSALNGHADASHGLSSRIRELLP